MEIYRRQFKQEVEDELRLVRVSLKRCEETLQRLTYDDQPFRTVELVKKKTQELETLQEKEKALALKVEQIEAGMFDAELEEARATATAEAKEKALLTQKKKQAKAIAPRPKMAPAARTGNRFITDREKARDFDYFERSCAKFPDNLARKLHTMPNNHGIIFNSIHFYGRRPPRSPVDTYVMQDKQGDKFYVHYYTPTEHRVYVKERHGRSTREVLVFKEEHQRIETGL